MSSGRLNITDFTGRGYKKKLCLISFRSVCRESTKKLPHACIHTNTTPSHHKRCYASAPWKSLKVKLGNGTRRVRSGGWAQTGDVFSPISPGGVRSFLLGRRAAMAVWVQQPPVTLISLGHRSCEGVGATLRRKHAVNN